MSTLNVPAYVVCASGLALGARVLWGAHKAGMARVRADVETLPPDPTHGHTLQLRGRTLHGSAILSARCSCPVPWARAFVGPTWTASTRQAGAAFALHMLDAREEGTRCACPDSPSLRSDFTCTRCGRKPHTVFGKPLP